MKRDEAIEAIRAIRHKISAEHGHETRRLVRHYQEMEKRYADRIVREPARPGSADEPTRNTMRRDVMAWEKLEPIQDKTKGEITIEPGPVLFHERLGWSIEFRATWRQSNAQWRLEISEIVEGAMRAPNSSKLPDDKRDEVLKQIGRWDFEKHILPTLPDEHDGRVQGDAAVKAVLECDLERFGCWYPSIA